MTLQFTMLFTSVYRCVFLVGSIFVLWSYGYSQQPGGVLEVSGRVIEKNALNGTNGLAGIEIYVRNYGSFKTVDGGHFTFKIPRNLEPKIEIIPSSYKVLRPLDGKLPVDPLKYTIEIYVVSGSLDSLTAFQLRQLDDEIAKLNKENKLTKSQIAKMDRQLLDTVLFFRNKQQGLQKQVSSLDQQLKQAAAKNQKLSDSLRWYSSQLTTLQDSLTLLMNQLTIALEKKYLQQKETFDRFSAELLDYVSKLKDLHNWMSHVSDGFKNNGALVEFNKVCLSYSKARDALYNNHQSHLAAIKHYWENPAVDADAQQVFEVIFKEIHDPIVLGIINPEIIKPYQDYAMKGVRQVKTVSKGGEKAGAQLKPLANNLQAKTDVLLDALKNNM